MSEKNEFIEKSSRMLSNARSDFRNLPSIKLKDLIPKRTAVVLVDMINGFIREGALHDKGISAIVSPACQLLEFSASVGMKVAAFADCHSRSSTEFSAFPVHCLKGSSESEIVDELKKTGGYILIEKNSTNGFHAPGFHDFLSENPDMDCFIVCGDCTDICVMNFCLTLKTFFDQQDRKCRIIVPVNMVETYNAEGHYNEFMNTAAFIFMKNSGIELVGGTDLD